jgi:P-type Mg2+ transporter
MAGPGGHHHPAPRSGGINGDLVAGDGKAQPAALEAHPVGAPSEEVRLLGLLCNEANPGPAGAVGGNELDRALWDAPGADALPVVEFHRGGLLPFDHGRRMGSVLVEGGGRARMLVTKGAPESVLERSRPVGDDARTFVEHELSAGSRVVAVATKLAPDLQRISTDDEKDLECQGFLVFLDPPKGSARDSLAQLSRLGVELQVVTGDHPAVAEKVCRELGMEQGSTLTGTQVDALDDRALAAVLEETTIFARVSPEQKARIVRVQRGAGRDVAFLGDGVNDALALHEADVGISVDSAVDVAKNAADVVLLEKDLGVLANGVVEGRRIFSNTIKYVLMGTRCRLRGPTRMRSASSERVGASALTACSSSTDGIWSGCSRNSSSTTTGIGLIAPWGSGRPFPQHLPRACHVWGSESGDATGWAA